MSTSLPKLMGIVNLTPDSFSDGGKYTQQEAALAHIEQLIADGAQVIDLGAESTRPGATPVAPEEEWRRLAPVLEAGLARFSGMPVRWSVDTRHAETARRALELGVHIINDVSGLADPAMVDIVARSHCQLVVMHSLTVPPDPSVMLPPDADPVAALRAFADERLAQLHKRGIEKGRVIFDPGIGFGKSIDQSFHIIKHCRELKGIGVDLLVGHSRKSFLKSWEDGGRSRDAATLAVSLYLADQGVDYLRVHDVAAHRAALRVWERVRHGG